MGSPEQHHIPQRYDHAPIPFPLPTASSGPMALDPFAVVSAYNVPAEELQFIAYKPPASEGEDSDKV
jgi:hypothetical protein